ncbi:MAG: cell surface protein, partial [Pirellulaceae bacterium]|nr:cell surface protein [Pirellulaceae bacterium]
DVAPVVTVIDAQTHETSAIELPHGAHSLRDVCVLPDGKHALVTHLLANFEQIPFRVDMGWVNVNVISVIDTRQRKVLSTIGMDDYDLGAGNPWDVTCTNDGKRVYASLAGTHELCVIDTDDLLSDFAYRTMQPMMAVWPIYLSLGESLWRRIRLPGKGPRGLAAVGSNVYVAQYFSDSVAEVDIEIELPATRTAKAYLTRYYSDTTAEDDAAAERSTTIGTIALGPPPQLTLRRRGELLFHDATICYQNWVSCASCHPDGRGDSLNWDLMNDSVGNPKNTKSMMLAHETPPAMAEGVRASAEVAVRSGLAHILFADRPEEEATAIDAYLKSLRPVPSPYLVDGQLSPAAKRGHKLFHSERVACHRCHPAPKYTDLRAHNVGTRRRNEYTDRFDTPTLIEVWRTAPYLHDGRYLTVKELLVEGTHGLRGNRSSELTEQDIDDLVEFVLSL